MLWKDLGSLKWGKWGHGYFYKHLTIINLPQNHFPKTKKYALVFVEVHLHIFQKNSCLYSLFFTWCRQVKMPQYHCSHGAVWSPLFGDKEEVFFGGVLRQMFYTL